MAKPLIVILTSLLTATTSCFAQESTIDVLYNVTGKDSARALAAWHGAEIAKQELAARGTPIMLQLYDGQSNLKMDHAISDMLAHQTKSKIMIGLTDSNAIKPTVMPYLNAKKTFISTAVSDSRPQYNALFNTSFTFKEEADKASQFLQQSMLQQQAVVIASPDSTNQKIAHAFRTSFSRQAKLLKYIKLSPQLTDAQSDDIAQKISQILPDSPHTAIYIAADSQTCLQIAQSIRRAGIDNPIMTSHLFTPKKIAAQENVNLAPFFYTTTITYQPQSPNKQLQKFAREYQQAYQHPPQYPSAATGYDAVMLAGQALAYQQQHPTVSLSTALYNLPPQSLLTGKITAQHVLQNTITVMGVQNSGQHYQVSSNPTA